MLQDSGVYSEQQAVGDLPIATIPSLRRSVTPGASGLQAAPSLGLPPSRIPSPTPSNYGAASSLVSLPLLPKYHAESDSLSSSPEHRKTDSSVYYTTVWGSPYATPSPKRYPSSFLRNRRREEGGYSNNTNSEEDSPSSTKSTHSNSRKRTGSNHKGSVKPSSSRVSRRFYGSIGRGAARGRQGNPIKDFTEEWINQYLSGQPRTERTNWLSDDSADSGTGSFLTARNHLSEDQSEGWLGLEDDSQDEDLLKTPTSRSFGRNKSKDLLLPRDNGRPPRSRVRPKHIPKKSTDTLKQSDFWDIGHELAPTPTSAAAMSDKEASSKASLSPHPNGSSSAGDSGLPISPIDKPLPPPPPNEANGGVNHPPLPASPLVVPKQTRTSPLVFNDLGRKCNVERNSASLHYPLRTVAVPARAASHLLTPTDVASRLKKWEEQGSDDGSCVKGLNAISQSRPAFPDPHESQREWRENKYTISFPDQSEWEAYVNFLKEEKLRALGVFLDSDPPASATGISPGGSLPMSQASSQFPNTNLPFSPPIPTSSAASNPFGLPANAFSAPLSQATLAASTPGAFASPATSPFGLPSSSSFPAQPGLIGTDHSFNTQGFPFIPFQPTPPAQSALASPNFFVGHQGGVSPAGSAANNLANINNINSMLPPISPLASDDAKQIHLQFPNTAGLLSQLQGPLPILSQQQQHHQQPQQQEKRQRQHEEDPSQLVAPRSNTETPADSDATNSPSSGPEIAHPTPRGHRHNVSETLQKGVEQAEYHLEDVIRRQLEEEDKNEHDCEPTDDLMKSRWAVADEPVSNLSNVPAKVLPQQLLFGEQNDDGEGEGDLPLDASDINTNPSLSGSFHGQFGDQTSTTSFKPRHRSRTSASTLNVEAREFDPSGSFESNTFSFTGSSFQPPQQHPPHYPSSNTNNSFQPSHSIFSPRVSQHSATSSSAFNVTAPSFAPMGGSNTNTTPSISSNTNFNFSTASFNIDAPVFNPGRSFASDSTADVPSKTAVSGSDGTHATAGFTGGKIFGDFDMSSVIIKPAKLSKAIPIIRPDDISMNNTNVYNKKKKPAEAAGTVGPLGREKRARREGSDGDKEVEFALPSHSPVGGNGDDMVPLNDIVVPAGGKENANAVSGLVTGEPEVDQNIGTDSKDMYPAAPTTADTTTTVESVTPVSNDTPVSQTAEWCPFEFKNRFEAAAFNDAFPSGPGVHGLQNLSDSKGQNRVEPANEDPAAVTMERAEISVDEQISKSVGNGGVDSSSKAPPPVLKPTAEAFEFKSAAPVVTPVPTLVKQMQPSSGPKNNVGLEGSRYAVSTPPSSPPPAKYLASTIPQHSPMVDNLRALEEEEEETLPLSEVMTEDAEHDSLNEDEIDAVMKQLNDDNADLGIERFNTPQPPNQDIFAGQSTQPQLVPSYTVRSNAPSPSIKGSDRAFKNLPRIHSDLDGKSQHLLSLKRSALSGGSQSPVRHLNNPEIEHVSDWDDAVSVGEDAKLRQRSLFFDRHVNEIVGRILENRLDPLEQTLGIIQQSLDVLASRSVSQRRSISAEFVEHSDADDEDEEDDTFMKYRSRSPLNRRDRRVDKIKQAVAEALASQVPRIETIPPPPPPPVPALAPLVDLSEIQTALAEIKTLAMSKPTEPAPEPLTDIRQVIIDAISEHPRLNAPVESVSQIDNMEALKFQVEGMQAMLRVAEERAEKEYQTRKDAQDSLAQCQRLLRIAEEDAAQHRESALKAEETLKDLRERRLPETERIERQAKLLQEQQESLQLTLSELSMKNITLEETLDEYRVSADHWKSQVEHVKSENKDLKLTINHMKRQIEDSMAARQGLRKKFERLQEDMSSASGNFAFYEASWRKKEEDLIAKNTALRASYEREVKLREKLEMEIGDLQQQEKEATKLRFIFGQSQQENARLEELLMTLRQENHDLQNKAARFEREFNEARESSHAEIKRTRKSMEADLDAANNQVNYVRAELESQISSLQNQLDGVRLDADTAKARHELQLEEATDAKRLALTESAESKENALQEQRLLHERGLNDLRERHARALHNASEDRQRGESHLMELLALRDEKIEHLEDKLVLVEEKLEIAKSAARAAAQAAQNAKTTSTLPPSQPTSPSMTFRRGSEIPEKISPQALRESIMVLQDQLQQREGRIEELEQELAAIDKDAPAKVKERETEINWLRELLGVRLDDLQDIINTLSQPSFNQQAVRDAAIRLKANMQMEQQEKERAMSGGNGNGSQQFPSLSTLSNLAASPRSLPLAAAAAWGNWRKARENSVISNPSPANTKMAKTATANANDHRTPSKGSSNSPPSFLSGLLTPPSSNVRQSSATYSAPPGPMLMGTGSRRTYSESRPLRHYNNIDNSGGRSGPRRLPTRRGEKLPQELELELELELEPPTTPPLLRQSSYDQDAQARNYHGYGSYGDDGDSVIGGVISSQDEGRVGGGDAPFGPSI
ncbi:myosin class II heavy chain [Histoplasma capsulatum var. duboisii H88]|uniref:Myosin class II heavy chain n=1 Tax=Ajellomyces capsulatus (strain H88) TaxID=544711 RepID=F0UCU6_AJEC8|nr:myosin class II heavy chain [Histoplasma capsulatum var. duboisii H88]